MAKGHPISSLGDVSAAMRKALDAGKTGADVVRDVNKTLTNQANGGKK